MNFPLDEESIPCQLHRPGETLGWKQHYAGQVEKSPIAIEFDGIANNDDRRPNNAPTRRGSPAQHQEFMEWASRIHAVGVYMQ
ncbi:MAG: hypothetical protein AB8B79_22070 [Granulosicoccus sp.]